MSLSPNGDTLATTHVDSLGIMLWANRSLYSAIDLQPLPVNFDPMDLPLATAELSEATAEPDAADEAQTAFVSPDQIGNCISMSGLPQARWAVLADLATIKERNKPLQPPKAPVQAPFFLPAATAIVPFGSVAESKSMEKRKSHVGVLGSMSSPFAEAVVSCAIRCSFYSHLPCHVL